MRCDGTDHLAPGRGSRTDQREGQSKGIAVKTPDIRHQLDALANALRRISHETTRLRRSATADAHRLVALETRMDTTLRLLRSLQHQIQEPR